MNKRHDVIAVTITDPAEVALEDVGLIKLHDAETKEPVVIDTSNRKMRNLYKERTEKLIKARHQLFRSVNVDNIDINTKGSYVEPLIRFFRTRERRMMRRR